MEFYELQDNVIKETLQRSSFFGMFHENVLDFLVAEAIVKKFAPEEYLYIKGTLSDGTFGLIVFGDVNVIGPDGKVFRELGSGDVVGEVGGVEQNRKRTADVRATTPTVFLEWKFSEIQSKSAAISRKLRDLAWQRLRDMWW